MTRLRLAAALAFALAVPQIAASAADLTVGGQVKHVLTLQESDLAAMPPTELDADYLTGHGRERAHYRGVLLWSLLQAAGLPDEMMQKPHGLDHVILVRGRDGYQVALSMGEIHPDFEGKNVLIAYWRDGALLAPDKLQMVVPGDKRGGRAVHEVVEIELR